MKHRYQHQHDYHSNHRYILRFCSGCGLCRALCSGPHENARETSRSPHLDRGADAVLQPLSCIGDTRPSLSIVDVHSANENTILSVSGILGFLTVEEKVVRNSMVMLLILRIVDPTGEIEVRSWNRKLSEFSHLREKPVMISRARVTAYAGTKMIELIDGASGSVVSDSFDQASDLSAFWKAPADE